MIELPLGAWVDSPPREVLQPAWWAEFRELGFTTAAVMVETSASGLDEKWSDDQLAHAGVLSRGADVELALTYWLEPSQRYLDELERLLPATLAMTGAAALDIDGESNLTKARLQGFRTLEEASVAVGGMLRRTVKTVDVRVDFSTYTFHEENGPRARFAPLCDRLYAQAYAVRKRKDGTRQEFLVEWDDRLGPHLMPKTTLDRSLQVPGVGTPQGPQLCVGLAAYDQRWPDHTPQEAMQTALDSALAYKPLEARFWSTRHIFGPRANEYAAAFFRSLPQR